MNIFIHIILIIVLMKFTMFLHEFGHYIIAKKQGKFVRWEKKFLTNYIETTNKFNSRWDYLYGILFSFVTIPLWMLFGLKWYLMVSVLLLVGITDLREFVYWNQK